MIRHILLFRFNEGVDDSIQIEAENRLRQLGDLCPTIVSWTVELNFAYSPSAYDMVEIGDFASLSDLDEYKSHPAHKKFSEFIRPLATWALADIEFD